MNEIGSQITVAAVASTLIEWLKQSKWFPWLTVKSSSLNRMVAVVLSFVGAVGITTTYDPQAHTLLIGGLDFHTISHFAWSWLTQFVIQHGYYHATAPDAALAPDPLPTEGK